MSYNDALKTIKTRATSVSKFSDFARNTITCKGTD
jgi:hypothetical protein